MIKKQAIWNRLPVFAKSIVTQIMEFDMFFGTTQ
jgi:hypothetical protein